MIKAIKRKKIYFYFQFIAYSHSHPFKRSVKIFKVFKIKKNKKK